MEFLTRVLNDYSIEIGIESQFYKDLTSFCIRAKFLDPVYHNELLDSYKKKTYVFNHLDIEVREGDLIWTGRNRAYVTRRYDIEEYKQGACYDGFLLHNFSQKDIDEHDQELMFTANIRGVEQPSAFEDYIPLEWFYSFNYTYQELLNNLDVREIFRSKSYDVFGHSERFFHIEGNLYNELLTFVNNENWIKKHNLPF